MKFMKMKWGGLFAGTLVVWSHSVAWGIISPAVSFTNATFVADAAPYSLGWDFTLNQDVLVTHLGYYDRGNNGLVQNHHVGIFRVSDQQLLVSNTVFTTDPLAVGDAPEGFYRYHDIADFLLTTGITYRIVATTSSSDGYAYDGYQGFASHPALATVGNGYWRSTVDLEFPSNLNGPIYAGPNMLLDAIPEPASVGLLAVGALLVFRHARRNRQL